MKKVFALALNTAREAIRNRILYSILFFAFLMIGVSAVFGAASIGDHVKYMKDFSLFSVSLFGVVIAIVLGVNLLHQELTRKTIVNILSKPVARWQFMVGKFFGLLTTLALVVGVMSASVIGAFAWYTGALDWGLVLACGATLLETMVVVAVALFFSSLVVTPALAGMFTAATFIAGRSAGYLTYFFTDEQPAGLRAMAHTPVLGPAAARSLRHRRPGRLRRSADTDRPGGADRLRRRLQRPAAVAQRRAVLAPRVRVSAALLAPRSAPPPAATLTLATLALLVCTTLLTFAPTLRNGFLQIGFDDAIILDTEAIRALDGPHLRAMAGNFVEAHYVPATLLSLAIDHAVWQFDPFGFHLTNILLQALNAVLVWLLLRPLLPPRVSPLVAALVFAVHPLQLEAVSLAIQRKTLLAGAGFFTTLLCWQRWRSDRGNAWYAAAIGAYVFAALAKPNVVTLPAILWLYDYAFVDGRPRWKATLPFVAIAAASTAAALFAHAEVDAVHGLHGGNVLIHGLMMARVTGEYLLAALLPVDLAPTYYYRQDDGLAPCNWVALVGLVGLATLVIRNRRAQPWPFICLAWFAITLAPESNLVPLTQLRADRFCYLPMVAVGIGWAFALTWVARAAQRAWLEPALATGLVASLALLTAASAPMWRSDVSAWQRVVERQGWAAAPHLLLGHAFLLDHDVAAATRAYEDALRSQPDSSAAAQARLALSRLRSEDPPPVAPQAAARPDAQRGRRGEYPHALLASGRQALHGVDHAGGGHRHDIGPPHERVDPASLFAYGVAGGMLRAIALVSRRGFA